VNFLGLGKFMLSRKFIFCSSQRAPASRASRRRTAFYRGAPSDNRDKAARKSLNRLGWDSLGWTKPRSPDAANKKESLALLSRCFLLNNFGIIREGLHPPPPPPPTFGLPFLYLKIIRKNLIIKQQNQQNPIRIGFFTENRITKQQNQIRIGKGGAWTPPHPPFG